jgi:hypothetical protein
VSGPAAVRYALATSAGSQRWLAPSATFVAAVLVLYAQGGDAGTTIAMGTVVLFAAGAWLAASLAYAETTDRVAVTAAMLGGVHRARLSVVAAAVVWGQALVVVSLVVMVLLARGVTLPWLLAAVVAHETVLIAGVAVGSACAPPLLGRAGWSMALVLAVGIAELGVPWAAPVRLLVDALDTPGSSPPWALLVGLLVATVAASAALLGATWAWAWRRG